MFSFLDFMFVGYSDNAIRHLSCADHMKKVKGFLWKYGGGMDKVDTLRITETDFSKVLVIYFTFICMPCYCKFMLFGVCKPSKCLSLSLSPSPSLTINYNNFCTFI